MFKLIKKRLQKSTQTRSFVLVAVFGIMAALLVYRLFDLQIVKGEDYLTNFTLQIRKEKTIKSTRGAIYDVNGKPLAYNKLAYTVTFEDSGNYSGIKERNLLLNSSMYGLLRVIEDNGNSILLDFGIALDRTNNFYFTRSGVNLLRFKADIYGQAYVENLTDAQKNATADEMMEELCGDKWYGILNPAYTDAELAERGLPKIAEMDKETILKLVIMRSKVAANSYQKYLATEIAKDINEETVAIIMENKDVYAGVDVIEDSIRVYGDGGDDSIYLAPLLGYTGQISQEELDRYNQDGEVYDNNDIVGKVGLEQSFEAQLQGVDGSETIYVDNLGKILLKESEVAPQAGNDIQLTIDSERTEKVYHILEQYIAGILYKNIFDGKTFDTEAISSSDDVRIPVYDVYYALFENQVLNVQHLASEDASSSEQAVYQAFLQRSDEIYAEIRNLLTTDNPLAYNEYDEDKMGAVGEEWQVYMTYIVDELLMNASAGTPILDVNLIDTNDPVYIAWRDGTTSLQEYLTHAVSAGWLDVSRIDVESKYLDTAEILSALADYIAEYLALDDGFSGQVYKHMIKNDQITGAEVCMMLYDQGILEKDDEEYNALASNPNYAFGFIKEKIRKLEVTPAQLALEPCSGSVVITDPKTGDVRVCVTYPGYNNNKLANDMDSDYYNKLNRDLSSPFYNKATQEVTAPGSTLKMVSAAAIYQEGAIDLGTQINCTGQFDLVDPNRPINCWIYSSITKSGQHNFLNLEEALTKSCNFYFNTAAYRLGELGVDPLPENAGDKARLKRMQEVDANGMAKLREYAEMFGFDDNTGIQIDESKPNISDSDAPRSAMGQSTNTFTTTQLARYVNTIANGGDCFDLTLLDKVMDSTGNTIDEPEPVLHNKVELPSELWGAIHRGMNGVANNNDALKEMGQAPYNFAMAGKTGTAQQSDVNANHALFVGYAPYDDPEMSIAVRITNGYTSRHAAMVARDIIKLQFGLEDEEQLITGEAIDLGTDGTGNHRTD